jgi:hypothetical protein
MMACCGDVKLVMKDLCGFADGSKMFSDSLHQEEEKVIWKIDYYFLD